MKKQKGKQKKDDKEIKLKVTKFFFANQGKVYTLLVTAPENVPQYRLKEIFDKNFVGKGSSIKFDPTVFNRYNGTYTVS